MNNFRQKLATFMYGRNGNDSLNRFLFILALALYLIGIVFSISVLNTIAFVLILIEIFRTYSKNLAKRRAENAKYVALKYKISQFFKENKAAKKDKTHEYFKCECGTTLRVPKIKGTIDITCPNCKRVKRVNLK